MNIFSEICSQFFTTEKVPEREMIDNVKYEKEKAMARFNMFQRMKKLVQIFELFVLLVLISWSTNKIPSAAKVSGKIFSELKVFFENPLVVFVIVNLIMLALFVLRKQNEAVTDFSAENLYDEYNSHKSVTPESIKLPEMEKFCSFEEHDYNNNNNNNNDDDEDVEKEMQIVVYDEKCEAVEAAIADAAKIIRRFERTQSERLKREIGVRRNKELRRSETENNRSSGGERKEVDHLSNEEFKLAVEDFINKHRVFSKQQKMADFEFN